MALEHEDGFVGSPQEGFFKSLQTSEQRANIYIRYVRGIRSARYNPQTRKKAKKAKYMRQILNTEFQTRHDLTLKLTKKRSRRGRIKHSQQQNKSRTHRKIEIHEMMIS